jgi:hypothetical protein
MQSTQDLDVFVRGIRGARRGYLFLAVFMLLLGGGGGFYLAMDDLSSGHIAKAVLKAGILTIAGVVVLAWILLKKYPGLDVLRDRPADITAYRFESVQLNGRPQISAVRLELASGQGYNLPLQFPEDAASAEQLIRARSPNARRS